MATSDSQERDAIDLAGLEDEVNLLLGEVDDLTGGGGAKRWTSKRVWRKWMGCWKSGMR
jgi:hypothetical protein